MLQPRTPRAGASIHPSIYTVPSRVRTFDGTRSSRESWREFGRIQWRTVIYPYRALPSGHRSQLYVLRSRPPCVHTYDRRPPAPGSPFSTVIVTLTLTLLAVCTLHSALWLRRRSGVWTRSRGVRRYSGTRGFVGIWTSRDAVRVRVRVRVGEGAGGVGTREGFLLWFSGWVVQVFDTYLQYLHLHTLRACTCTFIQTHIHWQRHELLLHQLHLAFFPFVFLSFILVSFFIVYFSLFLRCWGWRRRVGCR